MGAELTSKQQETFDQIVKRFAPLFKESDRGCVLLAVARLDEALGALHKEHITAIIGQPKKVLDNLFRPYAPLATLSARIQIAYAYGLISKDDFNDFETSRKIRNSAAHSSEDFSFEEPTIHDAVFTMKSTERLHKAIPEMGGLTKEEEKFYQSPSKEGDSVKMYFLTSCMALEIGLLSKQLALLGADFREALKSGKHLLS